MCAFVCVCVCLHAQVPMDLLSRFMKASFPDHTDLWMFQRQFTSQFALSAFASHVLMLVKGAPHTLLFELNTGNIFPWDLVRWCIVLKTSVDSRQNYSHVIDLCACVSIYACVEKKKKKDKNKKKMFTDVFIVYACCVFCAHFL